MTALLRFLPRTIAFVAFTALVYVGLIGIWGIAVPFKQRDNLIYRKGGNGNLWTRIHDLRDHGPVDILVVGGSHAFCGVDPRIFATQGLSVFILGSNGQTYLQSEVLINRYLDQLDPKLILLDAYSNTFNIDGVESSLDLITNAGVDLPMVQMAYRVGSVRTLNTLIYASERQLLGVDRNYNEWAAFPKQAASYVPGGFMERFGKWTVPKYEASANNIRPLPVQEQAFQRIMQHLASEHRKVVLIELPVTHWRYAGFRDHGIHERRMASFAPYLNFNGMAGLVDSTDFFDNHHLNQRGVEIFDRALLDSLKARGLLPQPRVRR